MHQSALGSPSTVSRAPRRSPGRRVRVILDPRLWLALYAAALLLIAFWPSPVDGDARGWLSEISDAVPWLTYTRIEVTANVLLFVPLGILLALILRRRRWLAVPIAALVTASIELAQGLFLAERTPSLRDVVANVVGAAIGVILVVLIERVARRRTRGRRPAD